MSAAFPAREITTALDWKHLVLREGVLAQVQAIRNWLDHNEVVMHGLGMRAKLKPGYRCLFHGAPGTGKTLTATLLGKYTERCVLRIDLSMVTSKYIGETEKNLAALFERAESRDWILFFDEADALFTRRTDVKDSHDRYANQDISYLLQRVEAFAGLAILASNLQVNIDEALLRRFNQVICFPFPSQEEREKIWRTLLPEAIRFEDNIDFARVFSAYELAGGSIVNVVHHTCLKAVARGAEATMLIEDVQDSIRMEMEKEGQVFKAIPLAGA